MKRWALPGDPHGLAIGADGTLYVGLAQPQAVVAIDPKSGAIRKRVVLDSAEIASTKELVTLRTNREGTRLYIANGSDESATILSLPDLAVLREITIEGEPIRDALPDPRGRFLYLLGRKVHVYDAGGEQELHTLDVSDPMAIAASANGKTLAVAGSEENASTVTLFETSAFRETAHHPLRGGAAIEAATFAAGDTALLALGRASIFELPLDSGGVKSDHICLPDGSGAQIAALAPNDVLLFAEQRCSAGGGLLVAGPRVTPVSLYGVSAYALAYDRASATLVTTDRAGYLTIYKVPRAPVVH